MGYRIPPAKIVSTKPQSHVDNSTKNSSNKTSKLLESLGKDGVLFAHVDLPDGTYNADSINKRTAARHEEYVAKYQQHSKPGISNNAKVKPVAPTGNGSGRSPSEKPVRGGNEK